MVATSTLMSNCIKNSCIDVIEVPANYMCNVRPDGKLSDGELHEAAALARLASPCLATVLVGSTSRLHKTDWNCFAVILSAITAVKCSLLQI